MVAQGHGQVHGSYIDQCMPADKGTFRVHLPCGQLVKFKTSAIHDRTKVRCPVKQTPDRLWILADQVLAV